MRTTRKRMVEEEITCLKCDRCTFEDVVEPYQRTMWLFVADEYIANGVIYDISRTAANTARPGDKTYCPDCFKACREFLEKPIAIAPTVSPKPAPAKPSAYWEKYERDT